MRIGNSNQIQTASATNNSRTMKGPASNDGSSAMKALNKRKDFLDKQMLSIEQDKSLSKEQKQQKQEALQQQMDDLSQEIGKQQLEEAKQGNDKITEKMAKEAEKAPTEEAKQQKADIALNYNLISASTDSNRLQKLTGYRQQAINETGENSSRVKRIENMMTEKTNSIEKSLTQVAKAIEVYSKSIKKEKEKEQNENEIEVQNEDNTQATAITDITNPSKDAVSGTKSDTDSPSKEVVSTTKEVHKDNTNSEAAASNEVTNESEKKPHISIDIKL
jgi:hypothetical protein